MLVRFGADAAVSAHSLATSYKQIEPFVEPYGD